MSLKSFIQEKTTRGLGKDGISRAAQRSSRGIFSQREFSSASEVAGSERFERLV